MDALQLVQGDVRRLEQFPACDMCVSNIPYEHSSHIVFHLLEQAESMGMRQAVLNVQSQFADRLVARAGTSDWNRLSANVQLLSDVDILCTFPRSVFLPPPKVDAAVVSLTPKRLEDDIVLPQWQAMTRLLFHRRNRTLRATVKAQRALPNAAAVLDVLSAEQLASCRAAKLDLGVLKRLHRKLIASGVVLEE
eukprot:PLAT12929.2.p1 GENE.PLAT12929.2~~PLAT12929.2.p1  ORF type:complete len:221 (+),score=40.30 PLAT12929.2:85-663(+)